MYIDHFLVGVFVPLSPPQESPYPKKVPLTVGVTPPFLSPKKSPHCEGDPSVFLQRLTPRVPPTVGVNPQISKSERIAV